MSRVLLRTDVSGLGRRGDIVEVARGFAQNYLIPSGRGVKATERTIAQAEAMRRSRDLRDARDRDAAVTIAQAIAGRTVTISARAGSGGRLFGSVTTADIAEAMQRATGAVVERRQIHLSEPIKEVGTHTVPVRLHGDVATEVMVEVIPGQS
jgi:large subunit ribosomal protein L9